MICESISNGLLTMSSFANYEAIGFTCQIEMSQKKFGSLGKSIKEEEETLADIVKKESYVPNNFDFMMKKEERNSSSDDHDFISILGTPRFDSSSNQELALAVKDERMRSP